MSLTFNSKGERKYFSLADPVSKRTAKKLQSFCVSYDDHPGNRLYRISSGTALKPGLAVKAKYTGEQRPPKKGEWYLSGAYVAAYRAPNDLTTAYPIAALVLVRTVIQEKQIEMETL